MKRHELTDQEWELVHPILPPRTATTGRPPRDPRVMLNGIFWNLHTGVLWRDLPERFGPWQAVCDHFCNWRTDGTSDSILQALQIRLDREGKIEWDLCCIDGSSVRASRAWAGAKKKAPSVMPRSPPTTRRRGWATRVADSRASSIC